MRDVISIKLIKYAYYQFWLYIFFHIAASRPLSSFGVILSNWIPPHSVNHSDSLLALLIKLLKPSGKLVLKDTKDITLSLKLNGFINVTQDSNNVYIAEKPNFEVIVLHQYSYEYINYFFFSFNKPIKIFNRTLKCDL